MNKKDATKFTIALSELVTDIILFAFPFNKQTYFDVEFRSSLSHLEIIVSELGEPFDLARYNYDPEKAKKEGNFEGAGFKLMKAFCDKFIFINKGREGKEFRLVSQLKDHDIEQFLSLTMSKNMPIIDSEIEAANNIPIEQFEIRKVLARDSEDIAKLIYRTYEYSYSKEDMYFPHKIEQTILGKDKLGVISRTDKGEAVGYFAVRKKEDSKIGEVGEAVVSPEYRRRGLMSKMMELLIIISKEYNLLGIFGKAVTNHPVSQKVNAKYGFKTTAVMLAETGLLKFKGFDEDYPQHVSLVIDFLPFAHSGNLKVYLPDKYKDILVETYQYLDIDIKEASVEMEVTELEMADKSDIELVMNYSDASSLIIVHKFGLDFKNVLSEMINSLEQQESLATIYIDLPLENPATPSQFRTLEKLNFIYSGLVPFFHNEMDFLRLQKVYLELDMELIDVYSDFGNKIKALIANEFYKN